MNQPDLGQKIAELRQEKGLTQEQLAEECEISTRTIQRIESGEVEPRSFTRNSLSQVLEFDLGAARLENENLWLAALHLSSMFCVVFVPLIIWSWKKNQSYKIDRHGRDVLNFQITITLILFSLSICLFITPVLLALGVEGFNLFGFGMMEIFLIAITLPLFLMGFFTFYQGIKNAIKTLNDEPYHYPLSLKFIK
jgi:uncharacterized Tic20 family protein